MQNVRERIEDLRNYVRNKYRNTVNFFVWGWRMREYRPWDYHYLLTSMRYNFEDMAKYSETYGHLVCSDRQAKEYRLCAALCKRINDDDYYNPHQNAFDKNCKFFNLDEFMESKEDVFTMPTPTDAQRKISKRYFDRCEHMKNQDKDILLKIMKRKIFTWWD